MKILTPRRTVDPTSQPVTLDEVKDHLRVEHSAEDALISGLIDAATGYLESMYGLAFISQTWVQEYSDFAEFMRLRRPRPVQSVSTVKYYDTDNAQQTVTASNYNLLEDASGWYLEFADDFAEPGVFDRDDAVEITYVAGYGGWNDVPRNIRHAIFLAIGHWYEHRSDVMVGQSVEGLPHGVNALMDVYKSMQV